MYLPAIPAEDCELKAVECNVPQDRRPIHRADDVPAISPEVVPPTVDRGTETAAVLSENEPQRRNCRRWGKFGRGRSAELTLDSAPVTYMKGYYPSSSTYGR